jgi:hypothetical protein
MESHPIFSGVWIGSYRSSEWSDIHVLSLFTFYRHFVFIFMLYFCKTQLMSNRYLQQNIKDTEVASCIQGVSLSIICWDGTVCVCVLCVCVCVCVCVWFLGGSIVCFLYSALIQQTVEQTQTVFVFTVSHGLV